MFSYYAVKQVMPDNRHKSARNAVSGAIYGCENHAVLTVFHPVKISAYYVFRFKENEGVRKMFTHKIIRRQNGVLDALCVPYARSNIFIDLIKLFVFFN